MTIRDALNPWRALREARAVARRLYRDNTAYRALLAQAHFRDPATGRIGRRGEYPGKGQS